MDFHYGSYTWNLDGGGQTRLSELFEKLNIEADLTGSTARFSDDMPEGLVELSPVTDEAGMVVDWIITSLAPFSTEHRLIVTLADGTEIVIGVTDEVSYYQDLRGLLSAADLLDENKNPIPKPWYVKVGASYTLRLTFAETPEKQFVDNGQMTYVLPEGISLGDKAFSNTFDIDMGDEGKVQGNPYSYDPATNKITVEWNTDDPNYPNLTSSANTEFALTFDAQFTTTGGVIRFSDTVEASTEAYTNLSVDFQSINVVTDPAEKRGEVSWNYSDNTGTFTIPDATKVTIEYDATVLGEADQTVEFTNTASLLTYSDSTENSAKLTTSGSGTSTNYKMRLFKYEAGDMSKGLPGAVFQLYQADGESGMTPVTYGVTGTSEFGWTYSGGQLTHAHGKGDPVYFATGGTGYATVQLNQNTDGIALNKSTRYYLIERVAPEGYELSTVNWSFRIEDNAVYGQYIYLNNDVLTVPNEPIRDKPVVLKKVGADSVTGEILSDHLGGAVFTIYRDSQHQAVATGKVNGEEVELKNLTSSTTDGVFFNGMLPMGAYYICETASPRGYNRLADDVIVQVTKDGVSTSHGSASEAVEPANDVYTVAIKNYAGVVLPATGGPGTAAIYAVGATLILIALALLLQKKAREEAG